MTAHDSGLMWRIACPVRALEKDPDEVANVPLVAHFGGAYKGTTAIFAIAARTRATDWGTREEGI